MRTSSSFIAALALLGLATGCTSGNNGLQPGFTSANLNQDKLQLAVGVATFYDGTKGLNTVETWRQPSGLSATGLSTPTITGPTGFVVPASAEAGEDVGTASITGSLAVLPGKTGRPSTLGTSNGVFSYGIQPDNSTTTGGLVSGFNYQPFYADLDPNLTNQIYGTAGDQFIGGPPAFPQFLDGKYPAAFTGFSEGFTTFYATPVAGVYTANLTIQSSNTPNYVSPIVSSNTLSNTAGLPAFAAPPVFAPAGVNGGTVTFTAPAGVTETIVNAQDINPYSGAVNSPYTIVVQGGGTQTVTFPDNIGPGSTAGPTFNAGDLIEVQVIGADYPLFELAPPGNKQETPALVGAAGQDDITMTNTYVFGYGSGSKTHKTFHVKMPNGH